LTLVRRSKGVLDAAVNLLEQEVKAALAAIETDTVLPSLS
jgi:hypothetical protein